jgi:hypothetical protein
MTVRIEERAGVVFSKAHRTARATGIRARHVARRAGHAERTRTADLDACVAAVAVGLYGKLGVAVCRAAHAAHEQ